MIWAMLGDFLVGAFALILWGVFAKVVRVTIFDDDPDVSVIILSFIAVALFAGIAGCLGHWILELK